MRPEPVAGLVADLNLTFLAGAVGSRASALADPLSAPVATTLAVAPALFADRDATRVVGLRRLGVGALGMTGARFTIEYFIGIADDEVAAGPQPLGDAGIERQEVEGLARIPGPVADLHRSTLGFGAEQVARTDPTTEDSGNDRLEGLAPIQPRRKRTGPGVESMAVHGRVLTEYVIPYLVNRWLLPL